MTEEQKAANAQEKTLLSGVRVNLHFSAANKRSEKMTDEKTQEQKALEILLVIARRRNFPTSTRRRVVRFLGSIKQGGEE